MDKIKLFLRNFLDFIKIFIGVTVGCLKGSNGSSSRAISKIYAVGGGEESKVSWGKLFLTV